MLGQLLEEKQQWQTACREVVQDDGAWTCTHMPQNPALPPPMPPPSPSPPPPPQPPRPFDAEYCTELGGTDYGS